MLLRLLAAEEHTRGAGSLITERHTWLVERAGYGRREGRRRWPTERESQGIPGCWHAP